MSKGVLSPGEMLGRFEVEDVLGRGGMGVVYKVRDTRTKLPYAAKILNSELVERKDFVKRFKTEAKTASRLTHMNVVHAYKLRRWEGTLYYIMEYVEGRALDEILKKDGKYPLERAIVILRDTAAALEYVHSKRYVHRDIKPGNILVRPDDHVKVIDFGLAQKRGKTQRTKSGHVMCTAKYMAPELIEGCEVFAETDIYALGCMTYELITGKPPFDGDDTGLLTDMHLYSKPKPLCEVIKGLDLNLSAFVDRMLVKDMRKRLSSAQTVHGWFDFYVSKGWFPDLPKSR